MAQAENQIRKSLKNGAGTDRLVNGARLQALEKNLGVAVKRHRDPGQPGTTEFSQPGHTTEDEVVLIAKES